MAPVRKNETVLKLAAGPQIVPVYGTDFRSTPVFFLQDDHDYFDNDEAWDEINEKGRVERAIRYARESFFAARQLRAAAQPAARQSP
jgi:hypothetical protein